MNAQIRNYPAARFSMIDEFAISRLNRTCTCGGEVVARGN